ncbi:cytosolic sulfotransferase 5-like [Humulus lupulus]|uniref:cytosolic sulfotransferase 5-like n=1 Tax=Humulus lupulus TaxID=3486 RepID=UPI002B409F71|nr:cytosolic sulfotransferase 5-like [Humulus lupulus]XP_062113870.1 cytosolic sulfotransferase 5-like [Humulus lupulus]XP_062113871.1 cytosolic sulfotransferase 5-like [Humulus lupulus]
MAEEVTQYFSNSSSNNDDKSLELVISQLPKASSWLKGGVTLYQNCWFPSINIPSIITFQNQFKAKDDDIIMASSPKSGATWLKSLLFSILNRNQHYNQHPLLTTSPHHLVPSFELTIYSDHKLHDLSTMSSPRLLWTHIPYASLSDSIEHCSESRIVYVSRNPLDVIVSMWYFANGVPEQEWTIEDCVDEFCRGQNIFGPYWDHVLGYWKASLEKPEKVLFLKYEEMKEDTFGQAKRIAEFIGLPFSQEEESDGVIEQILEMCSFSKLKDLDVNKHGQVWPTFDNKLFFRKGQVGDWKNHLTPSLVERVSKVIKEKLSGSGLSFKMSELDFLA